MSEPTLIGAPTPFPNLPVQQGVPMLGGSVLGGVKSLIKPALGMLGIGAGSALVQKGVEAVVDPSTGEVVAVPARRRRRRRRMLTCSDKADIAFLRGTLGGGELGKSAITALISSRCGR